jgi:lysozyme family protein
MKENRDRGLEIILHNEDPSGTGEITTDAGGRTRYGIAERYNLDLWKDGPPSQEAAKARILNGYWIANGCDDLPYPMDIAMADSCMTPGPGASATFLANNPTLGSFMRARMRYFVKKAIEDHRHLAELPGWIMRCLNLWRTLEA